MINNYRNKGEKVSFKQKLKHFKNRLNRRKDRNEGDKKGNSFVWGSGRCGGIITHIHFESIVSRFKISKPLCDHFYRHFKNHSKHFPHRAQL